MSQKLCPRARHTGEVSRNFLVATDPAIIAVARMVVAGADKKHSLHPKYYAMVETYGEKSTHELIESAVKPGGVDIIQTSMDFGGCGFFGALSLDGRKFIFYEWTTPRPRFRVCMTRKQARDIVSGKQKSFKCINCTKKHFAKRKRAEEKFYANERRKNAKRS